METHKHKQRSEQFCYTFPLFFWGRAWVRDWGLTLYLIRIQVYILDKMMSWSKVAKYLIRSDKCGRRLMLWSGLTWLSGYWRRFGLVLRDTYLASMTLQWHFYMELVLKVLFCPDNINKGIHITLGNNKLQITAVYCEESAMQQENHIKSLQLKIIKLIK